jgi:hypothetical protein
MHVDNKTWAKNSEKLKYKMYKKNQTQQSDKQTKLNPWVLSRVAFMSHVCGVTVIILPDQDHWK